jgi:hypothetical protein
LAKERDTNLMTASGKMPGGYKSIPAILSGTGQDDYPAPLNKTALNLTALTEQPFRTIRKGPSRVFHEQ